MMLYSDAPPIVQVSNSSLFPVDCAGHQQQLVSYQLCRSPTAACSLLVVQVSYRLCRPPTAACFLSIVQVSNSSLFPATAVSLYCTYLCYSAMQSEPHDYECNSLGRRMNAASGSTLALGMVSLCTIQLHRKYFWGGRTHTHFRNRGSSE